MKRILNSLSIVLIIGSLALTSCGGGGGGGGGSRGSGASTGIRVLHGAIEAAPVAVTTSADTEIVQIARFAESTAYGALPTGDQIVTLSSRSNGSALASFPVSVASRERRSIVLFGDFERFGLSTSLLLDAPPELESGMSAVRLVHGATGASALALAAGGAEAVPATPFGTASDYVTLPAGPQQLTVVRSADRATVTTISAELGDRRAYTVFVAGEVDYFAAARLLED